MHVSVLMFVLLHSPRCSISCFLISFFKSNFPACVSYLMWNRVPCSHGSMGTVKRPIEACLVGYAWVSELCASSSNRQLGAFNMSIPLINTSSDEVNLSSILSQERLTCILLILSLCVHPRASRAALFWTNYNFPKSFFVKCTFLQASMELGDVTYTVTTIEVGPRSVFAWEPVANVWAGTSEEEWRKWRQIPGKGLIQS